MVAFLGLEMPCKPYTARDTALFNTKWFADVKCDKNTNRFFYAKHQGCLETLGFGMSWLSVRKFCGKTADFG
jgi:hypothetical protein